MSKRYLLNAILDAHTAAEIAEEDNITEEQAAKVWFDNVICDNEGKFEHMPQYHNFIGVINKDWDLYYDYGASYYFAVNNKKNLNDLFEKALQYVRDNHEWSEACEAYALETVEKMRCPIDQASDEIENEICVLMDNFGYENDLPDDWWSDWSVDDIFFKL